MKFKKIAKLCFAATSNFQLPTSRCRNGSALVFVMVALLFLAGVGLTFVFWLSSESRQAGRRQAVTRDYYVAEAGTEKAILDVKNPASPYIWTRGFTYTSSYILNGEQVEVKVTNVGEQ
ncbi:MAG: hypothetical protein HY919_01705 [Elusimicrobia bacterium]|nr:hypothetical protein [Elusimicrobiota bacterium]